LATFRLRTELFATGRKIPLARKAFPRDMHGTRVSQICDKIWRCRKGHRSMSEEDGTECPATARGIMQCLGMLAEEAASLDLTKTMLAIREALKTCSAEGAERIGMTDIPVRFRPLLN
jgi:hypothetical protein